MSVYTESQTQINDLDTLCSALDAVGMPYTRYDASDGIYRKWARHGGHKNEEGRVRGEDACLVIHGGLDRTSRRFCGDTAFVWEDGSLQAKLDVTHGDSAQNWDAVQAEYTAQKMESLAKTRGYRTERTTNERGQIRLRIHAAGTGPSLARRRLKG